MQQTENAVTACAANRECSDGMVSVILVAVERHGVAGIVQQTVFVRDYGLPNMSAKLLLECLKTPLMHVLDGI